MMKVCSTGRQLTGSALFICYLVIFGSIVIEPSRKFGRRRAGKYNMIRLLQYVFCYFRAEARRRPNFIH